MIGLGQNTVDHLCVVDALPAADTKQRLVGYAVQPGGQIATALAALGRWGARAAYVGTFGDDDAGRLARISLAAHGVDVSAALVRAGAPNQLSIILVNRQTGERTVLWHRAADLGLAAEEVPRARIEASRILFLDGLDGPAACAAARVARAAGVPSVADLDGSCAEPGVLVPLVDVLIVSQEFARGYTGVREPAAALRALAREAGAVVGVTLGREGALVAAGGRELRAPGYAVAPVDTTGAGDLFHAGFLWGMLHDLELEDTLRLANAAAALQCTQLGGREAIPTLAAARALAGL